MNDQDRIKHEPETIEEAYRPDEDADFDGHEAVSQEEGAAEWAKRIEELEAANADFIKALQRERADFDNFRKRNQAAVADALRAGTAETIAAILPVLDNFERALCAVPEKEREAPFVKGMQMVYKQLKDILAGMGLEEIPAKGESFDPNLHHAVMQEAPGEGEREGCVKEVMSKGYTLDGRVLRHSMVKVAGHE